MRDSSFPNKQIVSFVLAATFLLTPLLTPHAHAMVEDEAIDESLMDYDSIVRELSRGPQSTNTSTLPGRPHSPFDDVLMHGGVGLTGTVARFMHEGKRVHMNQQGIQAALGIDLFSQHWLAEGTARSFGDVDYNLTNVSLKEFDLKIYYHERMSGQIGMRIGGGLSARYLSIREGEGTPVVHTTPSSIASLGLEYFISNGISVGTEIATRNSMITETIDRSSFDATVRFDTHF